MRHFFAQEVKLSLDGVDCLSLRRRRKRLLSQKTKNAKYRCTQVRETRMVDGFCTHAQSRPFPELAVSSVLLLLLFLGFQPAAEVVVVVVVVSGAGAAVLSGHGCGDHVLVVHQHTDARPGRAVTERRLSKAKHQGCQGSGNNSIWECHGLTVGERGEPAVGLLEANRFDMNRGRASVVLRFPGLALDLVGLEFTEISGICGNCDMLRDDSIRCRDLQDWINIH